MYCDCPLPKIVGTIIGEPGVGKTSLILAMQSLALHDRHFSNPSEASEAELDPTIVKRSRTQTLGDARVSRAANRSEHFYYPT